MRLLRLALGVVVFIQGLQANEWLFVVLGGIFALLALLNFNTCALSGAACSTSLTTNDKKKEENSNKTSH